MATAKRAETAQELREKYQRKRLSPSTAAQYYLYNYLFWAYLKNEQKPIDYLRDRVLKDDTRVYDTLGRDHIAGGNAVELYRIYGDLCEWLNSAFESAVLMRNSLLDYIKLFYNEVATAIAGENLRRALGDQAQDDKIALWLRTLTVDALRPTDLNYHDKILLRQRIERNLCYLNAYDTLIEIIAKQIKVPELTFLQVDMSAVIRWIGRLNEALEALREEIGKREVVPDGEAQPSLSPPFTPKELEETLKAFEDVSYTAPPIPKENLQHAENHVKTILSASSNFTWSGAFGAISKDYWRR